MKPFLEDNEANVKMVGAVVAILVTLIISVVIFYNIAGSIDYDTANENIAENVYGLTANTDEYNATVPATNGSNDILDQAATFYTIAPIVAIVIVAVVILGYVGKIGGRD